MSINNFLLVAFWLITLGVIAQEQPTIIEGVNVFTGEDYLEHTNVAFHHGQIVFIGEPTEGYRSSVTINGSGHTIVPPLINAHTHIWSANNLKESLSHGIFANLDMHTTDEAASRLRRYNDSLRYARYYSSNAGAPYRADTAPSTVLKYPPSMTPSVPLPSSKTGSPLKLTISKS